MVTVTPGMTAPESSATRPLIAPVPDVTACAKARDERERQPTNTNNPKTNKRRIENLLRSCTACPVSETTVDAAYRKAKRKSKSEKRKAKEGKGKPRKQKGAQDIFVPRALSALRSSAPSIPSGQNFKRALSLKILGDGIGFAD